MTQKLEDYITRRNVNGCYRRYKASVSQMVGINSCFFPDGIL